VEIRNHTPHPVKILDHNNNVVRVIEPSGTFARLAESTRPAGDVDGIPLAETTYGQLTGVPAPEPGVVHIVPLVTALAVRASGDTRQDLLVPADQVREGGTVVGCRGLARVAAR
jgi:hypothetical protein